MSTLSRPGVVSRQVTGCFLVSLQRPGVCDLPLGFVFLLLPRNFFDPDLHAVSTERDIFPLQFLSGLMSDVVCDRPYDERNRCDDAHKDQCEDQRDNGTESGHDREKNGRIGVTTQGIGANLCLT